MTLFLVDFVHTDNGFTCSESGFGDLSTAQNCSDAVSYAKSFNSKAVLISIDKYYGDKPKGCYILGAGNMVFNTHSTGGRQPSATSICKKGNT